MVEKTVTCYAGGIIRVMIALLFLYAGVTKLIDPAAFMNDIQNYRITPYALSLAVSLFLPWLEILCAISLFVKRFKPGAYLILSTLMLVFIIAIASAWIRDLDITCGCFGGSEKVPYWQLLLRDITLLVAIIYASVFDKDRKKTCNCSAS